MKNHHRVFNKTQLNSWETEEEYEYTEHENPVKTKTQKKAEKKFDYLFSDKQYQGLLLRGLENMSEEKLHEILGG